MFFKDYFNSIADIINSRYIGHITLNQNNADRGELCELFIKDYLLETIGDSFKIARGGKIIDCTGNQSKQLDIILTAKKSLGLFYDKGIYPTESVYAVVSVTSSLDKEKLMQCCKEFISIPKSNYAFLAKGFLDSKYSRESEDVWKKFIPYKCVFAYSGDIREEWIEGILDLNSVSINPLNTCPDLIIVNKKGFIEKRVLKKDNGEPEFELRFISFDNFKYYGFPFCKMLYDMNNLSHEEFIMSPRLEEYFNQDLKGYLPFSHQKDS